MQLETRNQWRNHIANDEATHNVHNAICRDHPVNPRGAEGLVVRRPGEYVADSVRDPRKYKLKWLQTRWYKLDRLEGGPYDTVYVCRSKDWETSMKETSKNTIRCYGTSTYAAKCKPGDYVCVADRLQCILLACDPKSPKNCFQSELYANTIRSPSHKSKGITPPTGLIDKFFEDRTRRRPQVPMGDDLRKAQPSRLFLI